MDPRYKDAALVAEEGHKASRQIEQWIAEAERLFATGDDEGARALLEKVEAFIREKEQFFSRMRPR